jgi:membrane protease YdiL (CAAX protease family)
VNEFDQPVLDDPENSFQDGASGLAPSFQPRLGTFILLFFLIVIWPTLGLSMLLLDDTSIDWDLYDPVYFIFLPTIILQWFFFLAIALGIYRENSDFRSIGFVRIKISDIFYAVGFLIISNLILSAMQLFLSLFNLSVSPDVDVLVEKAGESVWWWLAVSVTAAVCEETAFRGYILTRVKGVFRKSRWVLPVVLSTFAFASGHSYQGVGGLILLFAYGLMFCGLYLYTKSLWPCILAHFIQNFSAIFLYEFIDF